MLSGRDTLGQIDRTLKSARGELERLDQQLQATSQAVTFNKLEQARAIDRMAGIRLDAIRRGEVVAHLESAMDEARRILASREAAITGLEEKVTAANQALHALEEQRSAIHDEVDAAAKTLAGREAAVQQQLERDETYRAQLEHTRQADAVAVSALEKARLAEADRKSKSEPFESDELFMYLWNRGYGTSEYSANPLARMLDGWVARRCGYQEARANFWMLREIPRRLAEHADHAREAADAELDKLQDLEELAAKEGMVPDARSALEHLEQRQDALDRDIAEAEAAVAALLVEQSGFVSGADDYLRQALRALSAAMERRDVDELETLARATVTAEDDGTVDELRRLRRQYMELEEEMGEVRDQQRARISRIQELEDVRREFKRRKYDDVHSRFDKREMIERMIGEVIAGIIQGSTLWKTLRRYQHYDDILGEWPDFGSGGIVRPDPKRRRKPRQRPPTWHWPGSTPGRGGGFRVPRPKGGSGGRGGFRTGGGF